MSVYVVGGLWGGSDDGSVEVKQEQASPWLRRGSHVVWTWQFCVPDLGPSIGCSSIDSFFFELWSGSEVGACVILECASQLISIVGAERNNTFPPTF